MFIEAKDDGSAGDNWTTGAVSRAKPVKSSPPTNQHSVFYRPDALPVAQPTVSKHWRENITFHGLAYPKLTGVFQRCLWPLIAPGYLGGCHASHQPSDASTPSVGQTWDAIMIDVFLMTSNLPITKALPHHFAVCRQCLIYCGIRECTVPAAQLLFSLTSEWRTPRQPAWHG